MILNVSAKSMMSSLGLGDPVVHSERSELFFSTYRKPLTEWRAAKGFQQNDYAFRNATWHVADVFAEMYESRDRRDGFLDPLSMLRDGAVNRLTSEHQLPPPQ